MHTIIWELFFEYKFIILIKIVFFIKQKHTTPAISSLCISKSHCVYKLTSIRDYVYQVICLEYVNYLR